MQSISGWCPRPANPEPTLLSRYYKPLDLDWVKKTTLELDGLDRKWFLRDAVLCDPFVLAWVLMPRYNWKGFHRYFAEHIIYHNKALLLASRDHGKSTVTARILQPWSLLNNPNLATCVVSATAKKAWRCVIPCRRVFENEFIKWLFDRDFVGEDWLKTEFSLAGRSPECDNPSVIGFGCDASVTGSHPVLAFCDDTVDLAHKFSSERRDKHAEFMRMSFFPALEPEAQVGFIGTRYHSMDWYGVLIDEGWCVNEYFKECFVDFDPDQPVTDHHEVIWPEKFKPEFFHDRYKKDELSFRAQYLNDCARMEGRIWREDFFRHSAEPIQDRGVVTIGVDTAYTTASQNDYSAIVVCRRLSTGVFVVEQAIQGKWGTLELIEKIYELYVRYAAQTVVIEKFTHNKVDYQNKMSIVNMLRGGYNLKVAVTTPCKDKITRYHEIVPLWEAGMVIHRPGLHDLEYQMKHLPDKSLKDDLADALEIAITAAQGSPKRYFNGPRVL